MSMREELKAVRGILPPPEPSERAELREIRRAHVSEPSPYVPRPIRPEAGFVLTPAPITTSVPVNTQPAKAPSSGSAKYLPSLLKYGEPSLLKYGEPSLSKYGGVARPSELGYSSAYIQKWRPTHKIPAREFPFEKLEEMRKKRLAKMPEEKPVMPAIPPTIKFGAYEVKTEHVAIGALALIIIAVVILT